LLCYILAVSLATPLNALGRTVEQFGRGGLAARVKSTRRDEIGELARSFDEMADRIQTLLTAERRLL
jgi:two-component system sensor histidine kinase CpxA